MQSLYDEQDEPPPSKDWQPAKFERKRERELVEQWWKWAEKVGLLCLEHWERFVYRHAALCFAMKRPVTFWNENFQTFAINKNIPLTQLPIWNHYHTKTSEQD